MWELTQLNVWELTTLAVACVFGLISLGAGALFFSIQNWFLGGLCLLVALAIEAGILWILCGFLRYTPWILS